ncbi:MAG: hydroxylamine reductase [Anaerolineaceae bacterium]
MNEMFCYQCQETMRNSGCNTPKGMCGKTADVANLQDLLIYLLKGISFWGTRGRGMGVQDDETDLFVAQALFATITNANFDAERFVELIKKAIQLRDNLRVRAQNRCNELHNSNCTGSGPDWAGWHPENYEIETLLEKADTIGIMDDPNLDEDIRSLRELIIYGLKGMAAYTDHAYLVGGRDASILAFMQEALEATTNSKLGVSELLSWVQKTGEYGVKAMALLDQSNTSRYGNPEPTKVNIGVVPGPGILVSGHDLVDLEELLQQTEGTGINIYTHGEMLPTNAYPGLKKYKHLVGNYGGSWWRQDTEFASFNGPILMTTNCIVPIREGYTYKDRIFTTGMAGHPGVPHIADRQPGGHKDFSEIIALAKTLPEPQELESGTIPIGFAHHTVLSVADQVIAAVKSGAISRFVVMGGCDGRHKTRQYYTDVAETLPKDTIILTAGCAKYRYNKLGLGEIGGFPRVLDAGQCNDSYSLVLIAQALADAFDCTVNDLPLSFDIAWYEQKAVIVLLALLSLGVRKIRLGPTLPAFLSPNVVKVLVEAYDLKPIDTPETDVASMMTGA